MHENTELFQVPLHSDNEYSPSGTGAMPFVGQTDENHSTCKYIIVSTQKAQMTRMLIDLIKKVQ